MEIKIEMVDANATFNKAIKTALKALENIEIDTTKMDKAIKQLKDAIDKRGPNFSGFLVAGSGLVGQKALQHLLIESRNDFIPQLPSLPIAEVLHGDTLPFCVLRNLPAPEPFDDSFFAKPEKDKKPHHKFSPKPWSFGHD